MIKSDLVEKVMERKRKESSPDIYVRPRITGVRVLEFDKINSVLEQSADAMVDLKRQLEQVFS